MAILVLAFLTSVTMARALGPTLRGEIAAAVLWPMLLPYLGGIGLIDALVYHAARPDADTKRILGACVLLGSAVSVVLVSAGVIMLPWLLERQSTQVIRASQVMLLGLPFTLYGEFVSSLLRAKLMLVAYNVQRLIAPTGYFLAVIGLHINGSLTLSSIVLLQLLLVLLRLMISIVLCQWSNVELGLQTDWSLVKSIASFSSKSHLGASSELVTSRLDQTLIAALRPPAELGFYVAALSTTSLIASLSQAIRITILPQLASEQDRGDQNPILIRAFQSYWTITIFVAPLFAASLYYVLPFVYGKSFNEAVAPAMILVVAAVLFGGKEILSTGTKAMGNPMLSSGIEAVTIIAMLSFLVLSLPEYGIVGAALSMVGAHALGLTLLVIGLYRSRGISPVSFFAVRREIGNFRHQLNRR